MAEDILIDVEDTSKVFCRDLKRSMWYGLKDLGRELTGRRRQTEQLRPKEFWALRDISFQLRRGECLGLVGHNGAGKTTLLKMLNGLIKPDRGRLTVRGRVGAMIALGAGFNPILTGRENIYINGAVLGLKKREIEDRLEDIVDFAEIPQAIDAPVRTYSSGMLVRLGFAVATAIGDPDVLFLDEVLAVGDMRFRVKCYNRLGKLRSRSAVIFVSHGMNHISHICNKTMYLDGGEAKHLGSVSEGIRLYFEDTDADMIDKLDGDGFVNLTPPVEDFKLTLDKNEISHGDTLKVRILLELSAPLPGAMLRLQLYGNDSQVKAEWQSQREGKTFTFSPGLNELAVDFGPVHLRADDYTLSLTINDSSGVSLPVRSYRMHKVRITGSRSGGTTYQLPHCHTSLRQIKPQAISEEAA